MIPVILNDYSEDEQKKIDKLRSLIEECKELEVGTEDVFLTKYLQGSDWNVEAAFKKIHNYYDFKHKHPDWVAKRLPRDLKPIVELRTKFLLPYPDKFGRTIYVHRLVDAFDKHPNYFFDLVEFDDLIFEIALALPSTQKHGVSVILDMKGLTRSFLKNMNPKTIRIANKKNDVLPFKETHFHVVNTSIFMSTALTLVMPFLGKKLKDKTYFHGNNLQKLHDHFGYENLPHEYGGPADNVLDYDQIYEIMWQHEPYLQRLQQYKKIVK